VELPNQINLDWGENVERVSETEGYDIIFNGENYKFEGYNVYQLPSASASKSEGRLIATFDLQNQFLTIIGKEFDPNSGQIVLLPQQLGNNTGIAHYLEVTENAFTGTPLVNGIKYYFAVTAYAVLQSYDKDVPIDEFPLITNVENVIAIKTVIPQTEDPEEIYTPPGEISDVTHDAGTGDGGPIPYVVNPLVLTGHDYQVYFTQRQEVLNFDGDWVPAGVEKLNKPSDLTGTTVSVGAAWTTDPNQIRLDFALTLVSPTNSWADGVTIVLPLGLTIVSADSFEAGGGWIVPEVNGNVINMGLTNGELTENGIFHGGETWSIIVATFEPPIDIGWEVYDDGYADPPGPTVNAQGVVSISIIGLQRLAKYWNLEDLTTGELKLENQGLIAGTIPFPPRDDIPANQLVNVPPTLQPIVDGFRIGVDGGYAAPTTIFSMELNGANLRINRSSSAFQISDFAVSFGYADATAALTLPVYGGAGGTTVIENLQMDYELRWTGVTGDTTINGHTVVITKSGGSIATIFGSSNYSLGDHPLNPNPGSTAPFTVRVPFEVWNVDNDEQVNVLFWDRNGEGANDPSADGFRVWNTEDRVYTWTVNTPYVTTVIDPASAEVGANATWNWVFWHSRFTTDDVININYANPMQPGIDIYSFRPGAASYANTDKAKDEIDQINVFPNPYYGVNTEELNKYNRFVTFSHLPTKATIRIFNLAGVLVQTIEKDNLDQFQRWNLANGNGLPVASGLYIAYIEMPDLGETRILKLAIIQEQQILDRF
jgi:hypothetical protein